MSAGRRPDTFHATTGHFADLDTLPGKDFIKVKLPARKHPEFLDRWQSREFLADLIVCMMVKFPEELESVMEESGYKKS